MQRFRTFCFWVMMCSSLFLKAQENDPDIQLAVQLDSLSKTTAVSSHFAALYLETVLISMQHYQQTPPPEKEFISRFETAFAGYFFRAVESRGNAAGSGAWQTYFSHQLLSPLQYQLLGINAHINADLSASLTEVFTAEELRAHKKSFIRFQQGLKNQFFRFYAENRQATPIIRFLDKLPFAMTRTFGSGMMARWRKKQFKLALWHFTRPEKALKLKRKIAHRKERIDRLILRHL